jgi:Organic solute transporter Ostalpha
MPKFLCVKGILFFSFWQGIAISILVAAGAIKKLGPYTDGERISLGLSDILICLEMPMFAVAHLYAFSFTDFVDPRASFVARMPIKYALKDSFGFKDVVEDSKTTLRGEGMDYREFETSEGFMHQGLGRERRIRAGLRYSQGGKRKYWLPRLAQNNSRGPIENGIGRAFRAVGGRQDEGIYAPLLEEEAENVSHVAPDLQTDLEQDPALLLSYDRDYGGFELPFGDLDEADEELFAKSQQYLFGDYNYPCIDASSEVAKKAMWDEEERILSDERGAYFSPILGPRATGNRGKTYGAVGKTGPNIRAGKTKDLGSRSASPVIDMANNRIPDLGVGEVRLNWTKFPQKSISPYSRSRTLARQGSQQSSVSSSSSAPSAGSGRGIQPSAESTPQNQKKSKLPPDAIDLIVEDDQAANIAERSINDPSMRTSATGVRKVYKKGYADEDLERDKGKIRVEVENEPSSSAGKNDDLPERTEEDVEVVITDDGRERLLMTQDQNETVVKLSTPPPHARVSIVGSEVGAEDNPWV